MNKRLVCFVCNQSSTAHAVVSPTPERSRCVNPSDDKLYPRSVDIREEASDEPNYKHVCSYGCQRAYLILEAARRVASSEEALMIVMGHECWHCGTLTKKKCAGCSVARFCSNECLRSAWGIGAERGPHRVMCPVLKGKRGEIEKCTTTMRFSRKNVVPGTEHLYALYEKHLVASFGTNHTKRVPAPYNFDAGLCDSFRRGLLHIPEEHSWGRDMRETPTMQYIMAMIKHHDKQ